MSNVSEMHPSNTLDYCIGGMHLVIHWCLYWRDASPNTLGFVLEGCMPQYIRHLYWRNASLIH